MLKNIAWDCDALVSKCALYRIWLSRERSEGEGTCIFIMLNPSTADAYLDDSTIRRCCDFTVRFGHRKLYVVNLFTGRATKPKELRKIGDFVGPDANKQLRKTIARAKKSDTIICAWGSSPFAKTSYLHSQWKRQTNRVFRLADKYNKELYCLALTKDGDPRHPLYLPKESQLIRL